MAGTPGMLNLLASEFSLRGYRDWLRGERSAFRTAARLVQAQGQESPGKIRKPQPPTEVPTTAGASQSI